MQAHSKDSLNVIVAVVVVIANQDKESKRKKGMFPFRPPRLKCAIGSLEYGFGVQHRSQGSR